MQYTTLFLCYSLAIKFYCSQFSFILLCTLTLAIVHTHFTYLFLFLFTLIIHFLRKSILIFFFPHRVFQFIQVTIFYRYSLTLCSFSQNVKQLTISFHQQWFSFNSSESSVEIVSAITLNLVLLFLLEVIHYFTSAN